MVSLRSLLLHPGALLPRGHARALLRETQQPRDVQDEGYRAITKNRGPRDPFNALEVRLQALDDHLLLAEKLIHYNTKLFPFALDDDEQAMSVGSRLLI